jgi:uncharacterized protein
MTRLAQQDYAPPWTRVAILILAFIAAALLAGSVQDSLDDNRGLALVIQSGILLIVLGSTLIEHHFTKPADSLINSIASIVALITVYEVSPRPLWWLIFSYCAFVFVVSVSCVAASESPHQAGWTSTVARWTYGPAVYFGKARLIFSAVFLFGTFSFFGTREDELVLLVVGWAIFMALWPLQIPQLLGRAASARRKGLPIGEVVRRDWPGLLRVRLQPQVPWTGQHTYLYEDADGEQHLVIPLHKQLRSQDALGTALTTPYRGTRVNSIYSGHLYPAPDLDSDVAADVVPELGGRPGSTLIGFVVEDSRIGALKFETWRPELCREGLLVYCTGKDGPIYYQIVEGLNREEAMESDRLGSQLAVAAQLGILHSDRGFVKHDWLPIMNSPVFAETDSFGSDISSPANDFSYGVLPGTSLDMTGPVVDALEFHTAILGITGSGKTELAFDMIRHCVEASVKVICIDLTARYEGALKDLKTVNLSLSPEVATKLSDALFAVETGTYGAPNEKKALARLREELYGDIRQRLSDFLYKGDASQVGLITLDEISNSKATLVVTELFMTALLHIARDDAASFERALVVVEEAHTVMPESATMGVGDYEARGLVGKIAQIALQGRKYGVGLLVIAQRTATVSKSVLTQCNTVVSFTSFDETSVGFLSSMFGRPHAEAIRDLRPLQAIVFGKAVRSQRPVMVEIPYVEAKDPEGQLKVLP